MLKYLIFDLDDTIYPRGSGLMQAVSERISLYMIERMGMDPDLVPELRRRYWREYGTTSRGLQLLHSLDMDDYMFYVHDIDLGRYIGPDPTLDAALAALPQQKVIFTNATSAHARGVLGVVGVAHHFERIYDVYFCGNAGKPALAAYERLLDALGETGKACLMAEDSVRNLCPARRLGMTTVLVDPPPGADVDEVDYVIDRISDIARVVRQVEKS